MNIITAQKEKAHDELHDAFEQMNLLAEYPNDCQVIISHVDDIITNTVHAVLEKVKEVMPIKRIDKWGDQKAEWAGCCGDEEITGWNAYRTALLKSLEEMEV